MDVGLVVALFALVFSLTALVLWVVLYIEHRVNVGSTQMLPFKPQDELNDLADQIANMGDNFNQGLQDIDPEDIV